LPDSRHVVLVGLKRTLLSPARTGLIFLSLLFLVLMAACRAGTASQLATASPARRPESSPTPPPPVLVTVSNEGEERTLPASSTVNDDDGATVEDQTRQVVVGGGVDAATATSLPVVKPTEPVLTATPGPTYTPPAAPKAPDWDHYWLRRPVPEGSTVWTDKAYPYGSTRGGTLRAHHGVEFNVPSGTQVLAAAGGTIVTAGADSVELLGPETSFYGNVVVIRHDIGIGDKPLFTLYGHLSEILVEVGDEVNAAEVIALSGATGVADGPHVHFEVRLGANDYASTRNPLLWLYPFPDRAVVAGVVRYADGSLAPEVPLNLRRIDAPSPYAGTTSYSNSTVNPDDVWAENFAFDDVYAGYYELSAGVGEDKVTAELWVHPYQTNFVALALP
jgi:murein DD-endopeptidase MepM/ murein hydrolase activator NlpD